MRNYKKQPEKCEKQLISKSSTETEETEAESEAEEKSKQKPIVVTLGEPAGIGPDCLLQMIGWNRKFSCVVIGSPQLLLERAKVLGSTIPIHSYQPEEDWPPPIPGIYVDPVELSTPVQCGVLNVNHVPYVLECLERAVKGCLAGTFAAMVTGPVHKGIINQAGYAFSGHTEWIADYINASSPNAAPCWPVMLLIARTLRVALVTTHLPLIEVSKAITRERLSMTLNVLLNDFKTRFRTPRPRILVCGLNPHAGEEGHLGREEIDIIIPVIEDFCAKGEQIIGPVAADTAFLPQSLSGVSVVLAMYHDQGLPVVKSSGFDYGVNVTLGLPIIRTSVDHGTALSLAGTGEAQWGSFVEAIQLATKLAESA